MALTNYNILKITGTVEMMAETSGTITFDIKQGDVIDALRAGIPIFAVMKGTENGYPSNSYNFVNRFFDGTDNKNCNIGSIQMTLNDPDEYLSYIIEGPEDGGQ